MFGYIKVDQANLLGKEFEAYNGIYCTLCRQLGKDYSIFARLILLSRGQMSVQPLQEVSLCRHTELGFLISGGIICHFRLL